MRTLSVILGTLYLPALYLLGRRLFSSGVALVATLLTAVNPLGAPTNTQTATREPTHTPIATSNATPTATATRLACPALTMNVRH